MDPRVDSSRGALSGGALPYLFTSDQMGNSHLQFEACRILIGLLIDHLSNLMRMYRVGSELTFHLDPNDLNRKVVPDLYILEDEPQAGPKVPSWKSWQHGGKVPTLAIEVVSDSYRKDYAPEEIQPRYQTLGVQEVVRYDPDHVTHRRSQFARRLFGHFVRNEQGVLVEQAVEGEVLRLHTYPLWLVHRDPYYLRIATGTSADRLTLWPTEGEQAREAKEETREAKKETREAKEQAMSALAQARAEAEQARTEAEKAQAEVGERAAIAEAEVARLRQELARLRGGT